MCLFEVKQMEGDLKPENPGATEGKFGFLGWEICEKGAKFNSQRKVTGAAGALRSQVWGCCHPWCSEISDLGLVL